MSESRAKDVDAVVALIRQAMEKVEHLPETPQERVSADGLLTVLNDAIRRTEAIRDDEDH